ncbi:MAG: hypothetical protein QOH63_2069 [Acidobacteriota bacterium]|nr:hypothetical protein [Acidobacteriota bacterium]
MFCPSCGSEERQLSQFCRGCGTDLRAVRAGLERPDAITNSAATAREDIGRAIAEKIKELRGSTELKTMAEDVLPKIEEFLESPEEKRLRRMRKGVITTAVGLGAMLMFLLIALLMRKEEMLIPIGAAAAAFVIGLGMIINGKLLTVQKKRLPDQSQEDVSQSMLDRLKGNAAHTPRELQPPTTPPLSVIEHTTHKLSNEQFSARRQAPIEEK